MEAVKIDVTTLLGIIGQRATDLKFGQAVNGKSLVWIELEPEVFDQAKTTADGSECPVLQQGDFRVYRSAAGNFHVTHAGAWTGVRGSTAEEALALAKAETSVVKDGDYVAHRVEGLGPESQWAVAWGHQWLPGVYGKTADEAIALARIEVAKG